MEALIAFLAEYWLHGTGVMLVSAVMAGWRFRVWWVARRQALLDDIKRAVREEPRTKESQNGLREAVEETLTEVKKHGERIATLEGYILGKRSVENGEGQ